MTDIQLTINCSVFSAKLTEIGCQKNLERALLTAGKLHLDHIECIPESALTLLVGCSQCERWTGPSLEGLLMQQIIKRIEQLTDEFLGNDDVYSRDPVIQREKRLQACRKYANKPEIKLHRKKYYHEKWLKEKAERIK